MLGIHELWLFVLSGLLLNITPGPDTAYILGRTIQLGWRGGAAAAIGISCGCLVHVLGAAIGLSALLMASSTAFLVVKLIGAAYLVLTGLQMLLSRAKPIVELAGAGRRNLDLAGVPGRGRSPMSSIPRWRCSSWRSCRNSWRRTQPTRRSPS